LYFINIFYLPYISMVFRPHSEWLATKRYEIKYEKNAIPGGMLNTLDPAKRGIKWTRIESRMLDFRTGVKRALPARGTRLIGFPFREHVLSCLRPGCSFLPSRLWTLQVSGVQALTYANCSVLFLGLETTPGSFGEGPGTLTREVGVKIPLSGPLQVSSVLEISNIVLIT
jgi:hypothetical protein